MIIPTILGIIFSYQNFIPLVLEHRGLLLNYIYSELGVELEHKEEEVSIPSWAGKEVTGEIHYYNAYLSKQPFQE